MEKTTLQIDAILNDLAGLCCEATEPGGTLDVERRDRLVEALSTNGWERHRDKDEPLSTVIKNRVLERCKEPGMHRGAAIEGLAKEIEETYREYARFRASTPDSNRPSEKGEGKGSKMPPRTMG